MQNVIISENDKIVMSLIHYFVTEEDYNPIVVRGVKNEIWLENTQGTYKIIRINSNHIHNDEQFKFDVFKTKNVMKQIKKKTISLNMNTLNIFLDVDDRVNLNQEKNIDSIKVSSLDEVRENVDLNKIFPKLKKKLIEKTDGFDFVLNVTNDLNKKTEKENKAFEKVFKPKKIVFTYIFMAVCILFYLYTAVLSKNVFNIDNFVLLNNGALNTKNILNGEYIRIIMSMFLHFNLMHIAVNMYSLYILGTQVETYYGKLKMVIISLFSGICGGLLCTIFGVGVGAGFSGAIFGLLGSLLYFGYHYRLYLSDALKNQLIPTIFYNLAISLLIPGISFAAHIGGLVGGYLISMALGVTNKNKKNETINGIITSLVYVGFLIFVLLNYVK